MKLTCRGWSCVQLLWLVGAVGLGGAVFIGPLGGQEGPKDPPNKGVSSSAEIEIRFVDGSTMKVFVRDDKVELETTYGKLLIPLADIKRIEFGQRIPEDVRRRVDAAIADLGSAEFRRREAAANLLTSLKDKAYPALARAKSKDTETERRIEQVMEKIRESVPAEALEVPPHDIVHTATSKIAGRINADMLRVSTLPFGDQPVKLADMRTLRAAEASEPETVVAAGVLPDPGTLGMYAQQVGKTLVFRVVAPPLGFVNQQMGVFGTDVYTLDSSLTGAAIHAGAIRPGDTGVVRVTILGPQAGFQPSARNGILSHAYGPWPGFRVELPKGGGAKR